MNAFALALVLMAPPDFDAVSFGVTPIAVDEARKLAPELKIPARKGVYALHVMRHSSADAAGILEGDIITSIMAKPIPDRATLEKMITTLKDGQDVTVELVRPTQVRGKLVWGATPKRAKVKIHTRRQMLEKAVTLVRDEFEQVDFWRHVDSPKTTGTSTFWIYFSEENGVPTGLRLRVTFAGDDWVFANKWIVRDANQRFEFSAPLNDVNRTVGPGARVYESYDVSVDKKLIPMLQALGTQTGNRQLRYEGKNKSHDRDLELEECARIGQVLDAFQMRGGKLPE